MHIMLFKNVTSTLNVDFWFTKSVLVPSKFRILHLTLDIFENCLLTAGFTVVSAIWIRFKRLEAVTSRKRVDFKFIGMPCDL